MGRQLSWQEYEGRGDYANAIEVARQDAPHEVERLSGLLRAAGGKPPASGRGKQAIRGTENAFTALTKFLQKKGVSKVSQLSGKDKSVGQQLLLTYRQGYTGLNQAQRNSASLPNPDDYK